MKKNVSEFAAGAAVAFSFMILAESVMGRDGYVQFVLTHWIPSWVGVPLALVCLGLSFARMYRTRDRGQS